MSEISDVQRRTQAYWFSDGIVELVGGSGLLLLGATLYLSASDTAPELLSTLVPGLLILLFPVTAKVIGVLKNRITHQRTGYLKFSDKPERSRLAIALMALVVTLMIIAFVTEDFTLEGPVRSWALAGTGVGVVFVLSSRAQRTRIPRLYLSAVAIAAVTGWAVVEASSFSQGLGMMWIVLGGVGVFGGAVGLTGYLKEHPKVHAEPM